MIIYVFLLFYVVRIQNVSLHLRFLPSTQVSQHLQHWEGLPLLLPSGIAKKGSGNAWTAFKNPQNKRQVSVKVCSPFCAPEMRGHSNLRVLRFLGLHKRKSRNHTVQNSQTLRTKCAELGLLDECLGSVGLKSKISPFFFLE
jgi:hypothetical protein